MSNSKDVSSCKLCGNTYLAIRTDIYKDKRAFVYCDCCGAMADSKSWYMAHCNIEEQDAVKYITPLMEYQMYNDWCPYKGNPDPRTVWAAAIQAVNGLLLGADKQEV